MFPNCSLWLSDYKTVLFTLYPYYFQCRTSLCYNASSIDLTTKLNIHNKVFSDGPNENQGPFFNCYMGEELNLSPFYQGVFRRNWTG